MKSKPNWAGLLGPGGNSVRTTSWKCPEWSKLGGKPFILVCSSWGIESILVGKTWQRQQASKAWQQEQRLGDHTQSNLKKQRNKRGWALKPQSLPPGMYLHQQPPAPKDSRTIPNSNIIWRPSVQIHELVHDRDFHILCTLRFGLGFCSLFVCCSFVHWWLDTKERNLGRETFQFKHCLH